MKAFLEEYGLVIVAVIVVALLIVLAVYFGNTSKQNMKNTFDTFNTQTQAVTMNGLSNTAALMGKIQSETNTTTAVKVNP